LQCCIKSPPCTGMGCNTVDFSLLRRAVRHAAMHGVPGAWHTAMHGVLRAHCLHCRLGAWPQMSGYRSVWQTPQEQPIIGSSTGESVANLPLSRLHMHDVQHYWPITTYACPALACYWLVLHSAGAHLLHEYRYTFAPPAYHASVARSTIIRACWPPSYGSHPRSPTGSGPP
jgi:hypothetical protein